MRKGMKIWAIICSVFATMYLLISATVPEIYPMIIVCAVFAGMFFVLAKSPKENPYIFGRVSGVKKSIFVWLCFVLIVVLAGVLPSDNEQIDNPVQDLTNSSSEVHVEAKYSKQPTVAPTVQLTAVPTVQPTATPTPYTIKELLSLNEHPRIYGSYSAAEKFYENIGDNRVVVTGITDKALTDMQLYTIHSDKNVLYLVQHSMNEDYIGTVEIKILDRETASEMIIDDAVSLIMTYLPVDFTTYYKKDAAYIQRLDGLTKYTYACRLNDAGVEYRNSHARQYSYCYYFSICEYNDGAYWTIYTGYSAYGGKDKGWIDKNTEKWNIKI